MDLEKEIISILRQIDTLPEEGRKNVKMFAKHSEWGEALDTLCTQLYEYEVKISKEIYSKIVEIGRKMEMDSSTWDFLEELVK